MECTDVSKMLFDLTTVSGKDVIGEETVVKKTIVRIPRTILRDSTVYFEEEIMVRYREVPASPQLRLNIIGNCGVDGKVLGSSPAMPSLMLGMAENDYSEPTRNRDKQWKIDSQRDILNKVGKDEISPTFSLQLGKYNESDLLGSRNRQPLISDLFWSSGFQSLVRENLLIRKSCIVSDTNCIVTVYGFGVTGRLFGAGSNDSKMIVVEAYCLWNCVKYQLALNGAELKGLFNNRPDLVKAGKKKKVIEELLKRLYFDYTISIAAHPDNKWFQPIIERVHHLESPVKMPTGYPKSVEEMIRVPPKLPDDHRDPVPVVEQRLGIGREVRRNGPQHRVQLADHARKLAEAEENRRRLLFLLLPKRKRHLVAVKAARLCDKALVLLVYVRPVRPGMAQIRAHFLSDCSVLYLRVPFTKMKILLKIDKHISKWSDSDVENISKQMLDHVKLHRVTDSNCLLELDESFGVDDSVPKPAYNMTGLMNAVRLVRGRHRAAVNASEILLAVPSVTSGLQPGLFVPHHIHSDSPAQTLQSEAVVSSVGAAVSESDDAGSTMLELQTSGILEGREVAADIKTVSVVVVEEPTLVSSSKTIGGSWTSLGACGSLRATNALWNGLCTPCRYLGQTVGRGHSEESSDSVGKNAPAVDVRYDGGVFSESSGDGDDYDVAATVQQGDHSWTPPHRHQQREGVMTPARRHRHRSAAVVRRIAAGVKRVAGVLVIFEAFLSVPHATGKGAIPPWPEKPPENDDPSGNSNENRGDDNIIDDIPIATDSVVVGEEGQILTASSIDELENMNDDELLALEQNMEGNGDKEDEPIDYQDAVNDCYDKYAVGVELELRVFVPHECMIRGIHLPAGSRFLMEFSKDDLYNTIADRNLLSSVLDAAYFSFFLHALPDQVSAAELGWHRVIHQILNKSLWIDTKKYSVPGALKVRSLDQPLSVPRTGSLDANIGMLNILETSFLGSCPSDLSSPLDLALGISNVLFSKVMRINSTVPTNTNAPKQSKELASDKSEKTPDPTILMHVSYWQSKGEVGVVCVDILKQRCGADVPVGDRCRGSGVYAAAPAKELHAGQIRSFRLMPESERNSMIQTYLTMELLYTESKDEITGWISGTVEFSEGKEDPIMAEVADDNYDDIAGAAVAAAAEKAKARSTAAAATRNAAAAANKK